MALHDFKGSKAIIDGSVKPALQLLKNELDQRKPLWSKLTMDQKIKLIRSDRDPALSVAWMILKYLCDEDLFNVDLRKDKIDGDV